jgi:hypothetical protein
MIGVTLDPSKCISGGTRAPTYAHILEEIVDLALCLA